jgi:YVTN family beta-propeller protein
MGAKPVVWMLLSVLVVGGASDALANAQQHLGEVGYPSFVSPHTSPIAISGKRVFVVNTPSDTLDVIHAESREIVARVNVGIDPVSVAIRPDGKEIWVSNHISDSVNVIDIDAASPTYLQIVATVQAFDRARKATSFDEPMGIAFADNHKAYVALSSDNQIAVIDVASREVAKRLTITAQDPRAIAVHDKRLYVLPFESNNKTQLSGGMKDDIDGDLVTFDVIAHSIRSNSKLSLGHVLDIVKHPAFPDRDLYIFDTETDELIETVDTLGTLLYGMTIDSQGRVFVAQADARNDSNGRAGTKKHGMAEMENRAFLNQVTRVDFGDTGPAPTFFDLEPLPPEHPEPGMALATPYGIQISADDSTLVVSLAGSDRLITVDARSGEILGRTDVDAVPRGVAVVSASDGSPSQAWVLNAVENTVSMVDITDTTAPTVVDTVILQDPTHPTIKRGRKIFETASASTTATFACASCHPDGHTDQLLWVLNTPIVTGGDQIQPRITMPVRGLRDTEPYHWDGIPGDPYGGPNSANTDTDVPPNSDVNDQTTSALDLIDGGLANTMHRVGATNTNDEGKLGLLTAAERDDLAEFILSIPYPPAQRRPYDNVVSDRAKDGFRLFHIEGDDQPGRRGICGDCHRLPHLVSTNHPTIGMDTPTWRGAYDRFLILPQGRINMVTLPPFAALAEQGIPERALWRNTWANRESFDPVWDMVLEHSTGVSGSFGRQVTLNQTSVASDLTPDLIGALEQSDREGAVVLVGEGVFIADGKAEPVTLTFDDGRYVTQKGKRHTKEALMKMAGNGEFVGTLTARHGVNADYRHPQPAIWTDEPIHLPGPQEFPKLHPGQHEMTLSGRYVDESAYTIVDGRRVEGTVTLKHDEIIAVELADLPGVGMHLLQLQTPNGMISNDFIFHVTETEEAPPPTHLG